MAQKVSKLETEMKNALDQLRTMIQARYPDATFAVRPAIDDPGGVDFLVTVDIEDLDEVVDLVIDPVLELQLEKDLWIHVLPIWPLHRVLEEMHRPKNLPDLDPDLITPLHGQIKGRKHKGKQ